MIADQEIQERLRGSPIAGGQGHSPDVRPSDAGVTVSTRRELENALTSSKSTIAIDGDARIDLSGLDFSTSKTLVSDRGIGGSEGALLYTSDAGKNSPAWDGGSAGRGVITLRGSGKLVGLRFRGPYHDHYDDPRYPGYIPLDSGDAATRRRKREQRYARGVRILSSSARISNCEIYGWPNQAISVGDASTPRSPRVDHCHIHDCMMVGYGYGVDVFRGNPTIEACYFNATRHSVDGFGHSDCGYFLEDCVFGPSTYSHAVDMHCLNENGISSYKSRSHPQYWLRAGGQIDIRQCTFTFRKDITGRDQEGIVIRGEPAKSLVVENCRFMHERPPSRNSENTSRGEAWRQPNIQYDASIPRNANGFTKNWVARFNAFEPRPIDTDAGAPVQLFAPAEKRERGMPKERGKSLCEILG